MFFWSHSYNIVCTVCPHKFSNSEFRGTRLSVNHTSFAGLNESLRVLSAVLPRFREIRYKRSAHKAAVRSWISRKSAQGRPCFSCGHEWKCICACCVQPWGVRKTKVRLGSGRAASRSASDAAVLPNVLLHIVAELW